MIRALKFRRRLWEVAAICHRDSRISVLASRCATPARPKRLFEWSAHTQEVLDRISQARFDRSRLMIQLWAFRVTRNPEFRCAFTMSWRMLRENLTDLRILIADNPKQIANPRRTPPLLPSNSSPCKNNG